MTFNFVHIKYIYINIYIYIHWLRKPSTSSGQKLHPYTKNHPSKQLTVSRNLNHHSSPPSTKQPTQQLPSVCFGKLASASSTASSPFAFATFTTFHQNHGLPSALTAELPSRSQRPEIVVFKSAGCFFPSSRGLYHMEFLGKQNSKTWRWKKVESKESYWNANSNLAELNPKSWISGQWTVRHVGLPNKNMSAWFVILVLAACI